MWFDWIRASELRLVFWSIELHNDVLAIVALIYRAFLPINARFHNDSERFTFIVFRHQNKSIQQILFLYISFYVVHQIVSKVFVHAISVPNFQMYLLTICCCCCCCSLAFEYWYRTRAMSCIHLLTTVCALYSAVLCYAVLCI